MQVDGINEGRWYNTRFDQTHNLKLTGFYELSKRWSVSSTFTFLSGTPATFPTDRYEIQGFTIPHNSNDSRNNVNLPDYYRLDIAATLKGKALRKDGSPKKFRGEWVFTIYNVLNRQNPFSIYFTQGSERVEPGQLAQTRANQVAIIGFLFPGVTYNFKF